MRVVALLAVVAGGLAASVVAYAEPTALGINGGQSHPIVLAQQAKRGQDRFRKRLRDIPLPGRPTDGAKSEAERPKADGKAVKGGEAPNAEEPTEPKPPAPDEWPQEEIAKALRDCIKLLGPIAAEVDVTVPIKSGACGTAAPVRLRKIGLVNPVVLSPPATLTCPMVAALHRWVETQLQPQAKQLLGSHVVAFENVSAYSCRMRNGSSVNKLSEHALANAIDIGRFKTADRQIVSVAQDWGPTARDIKQARAAERKSKDSTTKMDAPPPIPASKAAQKVRSSGQNGIPLPARPPEREELTAPGAGKGSQVDPGPVLKPATSVRARFLKTIHERACGIFGTVLGPEANEAHRDHFHFDLAPRRRRAFCE